MLYLGCGCLIVVWLTAPNAQAQPPPLRIRSLSFVGVTAQGSQFARTTTRLHVGDLFDKNKLEIARSRLIQTGRYLDVQFSTLPVMEGMKVTFHIQARRAVLAIKIEGNTRFSDSHLRQQITLKVGDSIDLLAVRDGRESMEALYHESGFPQANVQFDAARLEDAGELVYTIDEGVQILIHDVLFEGNDSIASGELKRQIDSKAAMWIFRSGAFDEEKANQDLLKLQAYYRDEGYLDVRADYRRDVSPDGHQQTLVFTIVEGTRYKIESIDFRGLQSFTREELLSLMQSKVGEVVKRRRVESDIKAVRGAYGQLGFIQLSLRPVQVFSNAKGFVRLSMDIVEGHQFRVGRIEVRGNTRTRDKVARRALNLYPPDDWLDLTEVKNAERRLLDTRVFSSARIYAVGNQPHSRDLVIDVTEAEKAGDFLFGFGLTSNSGLVGNIVLDLQNFDLADKPRTLSELIKLKSFFGGGQRFRIELQPGTNLNRFRLDFSDPYFHDKPLQFDFSAYLFSRGRDGYQERRGGVIVSFRKRYERGLWQGWTAELALRGEQASVRDVDLFASREIRKDEGSSLLTSLKASIVRDRTNNRFVPTSGERMNFSYEQFGVLGGDFSFGKIRAGYTVYKTLKTDAFERKTILKLKAVGGLIVGNAPVFERFFAGGTGTMRGFDFRGVGERDGLDDNNIGGDFLVLLGAEYSYPLVGDNVRGLLFIDSGTVGRGTYRAAIGAGVRFTINLGKPIPLELDLSFPISSGEGDDEQIFSFLIGQIF